MYRDKNESNDVTNRRSKKSFWLHCAVKENCTDLRKCWMLLNPSWFALFFNLFYLTVPIIPADGIHLHSMMLPPPCLWQTWCIWLFFPPTTLQNYSNCRTLCRDLMALSSEPADVCRITEAFSFICYSAVIFTFIAILTFSEDHLRSLCRSSSRSARLGPDWTRQPTCDCRRIDNE